MQRRQTWLLNAVLAGFTILMGVRIAADWKKADERYGVLARRTAVASTVPLLPTTEIVSSTGRELIARNLFTPDRNNNSPQEAKAKAAAPLPIIIGTMRLGTAYEALMTEAGQPGPQRFRRVKQGEQVGPYVVAEIRDEAVVVEYEGQKTVVNVYQSAKSVIRAAVNSGAATGSAPASPVVDTVASSPAAESGTRPAGTPAQPNEGGSTAVGMPGVRVTIEGNRKRFERDTMFGPQVWYEDIKQ